MNAITTPEATAIATPAGAAKSYDAALAYLGGALMNALTSDGFKVTVIGRALAVSYLDTNYTLAEVAIASNPGGTLYLVSVRWLAGLKRRPGLYDIDTTTNRINTAGFLAAMHRETKRFAEDMERANAQRLAEAEADRIREANKPLAVALTEEYGVASVIEGRAEPEYTVPFLRGGEVEPADSAEGLIEFSLQPTMVRTTPELARNLFNAVWAIIHANAPQRIDTPEPADEPELAGTPDTACP